MMVLQRVAVLGCVVCLIASGVTQNATVSPVVIGECTVGLIFVTGCTLAESSLARHRHRNMEAATAPILFQAHCL